MMIFFSVAGKNVEAFENNVLPMLKNSRNLFLEQLQKSHVLKQGLQIWKLDGLSVSSLLPGLFLFFLPVIGSCKMHKQSWKQGPKSRSCPQ